jgi:hypothetical protein
MTLPVKWPLAPHHIFTIVGAVFNFGVLIFVIVRRDRKGLLCWGVAQAFMVGALILPALARWHHTCLQSLSIRYHMFSLPGLIFLFVPLLAVVFSSGMLIRGRRRFFSWLLLSVYLSVQLFMIGSYDNYKEYAARNRLFFERLESWNKELPDNPMTIPGAYEAIGTPREGLYPVAPGSLTPGQHSLTTLSLKQSLRTWW